MVIDYANEELRDLATNPRAKTKLAQAIVKSYRRRIQQIQAALDERDFYGLKSLHYEKLKGDRSHQRSMRLNKQMRLIIEIKKATPKNTVLVVSIEDYHD